MKKLWGFIKRIDANIQASVFQLMWNLKSAENDLLMNSMLATWSNIINGKRVYNTRLNKLSTDAYRDLLYDTY
jgi:hypothetical protein